MSVVDLVRSRIEEIRSRAKIPRLLSGDYRILANIEGGILNRKFISNIMSGTGQLNILPGVRERVNEIREKGVLGFITSRVATTTVKETPKTIVRTVEKEEAPTF